MSKFSDKLNFTMIIHNPVYIFFFCFVFDSLYSFFPVYETYMKKSSVRKIYKVLQFI